MDSIAHLFAKHPDALTFFVMGFITAVGASLWKQAKGSCLLVPVYLYIFGVILVISALILLSAEKDRLFLILGFLAYYTKTIFSLAGALFDRFQEFQQERQYREEYRQQEQARAERTRYEQEQRQAQAKQEQARREQEAQRSREEQQRRKQQERQQEEAKHQQRQKHQKTSPPKQPESPKDSRSHEEILGLSAGWTQDDLRTAYKRESQRTHPDRWVGKPTHIQAVMEAEFKAIQNAYNHLKK